VRSHRTGAKGGHGLEERGGTIQPRQGGTGQKKYFAKIRITKKGDRLGAGPKTIRWPQVRKYALGGKTGGGNPWGETYFHKDRVFEKRNHEPKGGDADDLPSAKTFPPKWGKQIDGNKKGLLSSRYLVAKKGITTIPDNCAPSS